MRAGDVIWNGATTARSSSSPLWRRRGLERTIERYLDMQTHPSAQPGLGRLPEQVMRGPGKRRRPT